MAEEPVGWSIVLGVLYDLKDGQPSMELLILPGKKIDYLTELHLIDGHYYLLFGENEEELNVSLDEFEQMLGRKTYRSAYSASMSGSVKTLRSSTHGMPRCSSTAGFHS